jgi:hypothetical protein
MYSFHSFRVPTSPGRAQSRMHHISSNRFWMAVPVRPNRTWHSEKGEDEDAGQQRQTDARARRDELIPFRAFVSCASGFLTLWTSSTKMTEKGRSQISLWFCRAVSRLKITTGRNDRVSVNHAKRKWKEMTH